MRVAIALLLCRWCWSALGADRSSRKGQEDRCWEEREEDLVIGRRPGGRSPPDAGEFSKILKNFIRKLQKFTILAYFPKMLTNPALIFHTFGRKKQIVEKF